ncbi:MAG: cupin domain-containing protein [Burkholderia sp.]|jgi:quercetin dioxygenase-like cupin family protein|uniref:cupin domain-containing protein n=1 Tax=Burkholderia TaxID=32008 RepID=UPI001CF2E764|nr:MULTISPECIES: cupin domain-containing protein [Burkholderia]MCA3776357.1 cupin domain-containing protein [Burkholderia sp.]MCA3790828.1 cupin domain-containing protein [Burkholderia sp.]MCA3810735.1 cupin domain-containing protein [Burkholderia sp.]MCA3814891.1 cupin domain-containing protein [Burkholderia sp.]MCA3829121.1 cupin domain-containing protein [Burkholderia sp.]
MIRSPLHRVVLCAALVLGAALSAAARAHDAGDNVHAIMQQAVPEAPGKRVVVATVDYAPGQASDAHKHLGSVFAVVSKGEVLSQVNGGPLHRYRAGEGWYEAPGSRHQVSRNASATEPAQLVVFGLTSEQAPLTSPIDQ